MKSKFLFPILLLFIFSCSDEPFFIEENEALKANAESIELGKFQNQLSPSVKDLVGEKGGIGVAAAGAGDGDYDPWCVDECNRDYRECTDWAIENRDAGLADCETIRIIGVEVVDVYCTENVIVGYRTIVTPEGEVIEVPIYEQQEVVCGEEEVNIYTEDPIILQEYEACKAQVFEEFVDAFDDCDIKQIKCLKDCKIPGPK